LYPAQVSNGSAFFNGGFETGDFSGWVQQDLAIPFIPLTVAQAGKKSGFGFFTSAPSEGSFAAVHGFDGGGPGTIQLAQDIVVPSAALTLEFDYRAAWDLVRFCNECAGSKIFMVNIETPGGGTVFQSDTFLVAGAKTRKLDTGELHGTIDVSAYAGSNVRISFNWVIPEYFTGPGYFQLDDVFIIETGPQAGPTPDPINFANVGLGNTDTLTAAIRNTGTQELLVSGISELGGVFGMSGLPSFPVRIQPGASETFEVFFTPPDSGTFTSDLTVESNDPDDPTLSLSVIGKGVLIKRNIQLIANVNDYKDKGYSDCWGYTAPDRDQYALLGVMDGVSIIDVTDPSNIAEVEFIPFVSAPPVGWYDIKTYQNYMYVSSEGSSSILIVDLSSLPDSASVIGTFSGLGSAPHNIYIDPEAGILYAVEDFTFDTTVRIFSLADPMNPVQLSAINTSNNATDSHDVFAQDSVLYIAEGTNPSIGIYDVSDPTDPVLLRRHNIGAAGYVHQVWVSEDNNYMMTTEETPGRTVKVWDIGDLNDIRLISEYLGESQLAHNAYIRGDYVYISHYESGLKVLDFSNPSEVTEFGFYDTYLQADSPDYNGAWGVYPFAQNGLIFVSDIQSGLYVLRLDDVVSVEAEKPKVPEVFSLERNYPNPFNPSTTIEFELPEAGPVRLTIHNAKGQEVTTLVDRRLSAGRHRYIWQAEGLPSGVYFYRLHSGKNSQTRKMVLIK
jgi:choice-of-anchor B domain-containing protein